MSYGEEESQSSNTSISLEVNVIFWLTVSQEGSWMLRVTKKFFCDTLQIVKPIEYLTSEPR